MDVSENVASKEETPRSNDSKPDITGIFKGNDGSAVLEAAVWQKDSQDRRTEATSDSLLGILPLTAGTAKIDRPRSGGRSLEVSFNDATSCCGAIFEGASDSPSSPNIQSNALTDINAGTDEYRTAAKVLDTVEVSSAPSTADESLEPIITSSISNSQLLVESGKAVPTNSSNERNIQCSAYENICRICHESDQVEALISPCLCRGSLSLVHRTCLQHWLAESDSSTCELCRFKYMTKRVPKYSLVGSFFVWIKLNKRQRRAMLLDTLGLIAIVPFATILTCIATSLADGIEYEESPSLRDVTARFAIVSLISMMTTIDVAFATWGLLRIQHHFTAWYSWYRRNSEVTLIPQFNLDTLD